MAVSPLRRDCDPSFNIEIPCGNLKERRAEPMEVIGVIVGILSLCGTFFAIGYQIGKDSNNTQK